MPTKPVSIQDAVRGLTESMPKDILKEALLTMLAEFMEVEVSAVCNAGHGERSAERVASRNGYRERELETRLGTLQLAVPRVRQGTYSRRSWRPAGAGSRRSSRWWPRPTCSACRPAGWRG